MDYLMLHSRGFPFSRLVRVESESSNMYFYLWIMWESRMYASFGRKEDQTSPSASSVSSVSPACLPACLEVVIFSVLFSATPKMTSIGG